MNGIHIGSSSLKISASSTQKLNDNIPLFLGTDGDINIHLLSAGIAANTATGSNGALIGTPVAQALAVNSMIISNVTASGDIAMYGNLGGNSQQFLFYDTSAALMTLRKTNYVGCVGFTQQTATGDGATTIDWGVGNKFYFTFGAANETFTFTAPTSATSLTLVLKQDDIGGRTVTWAAGILWAGGVAPVLTTTASAVDIVTFYYDGTNYHGVAALNFKAV